MINVVGERGVFMLYEKIKKDYYTNSLRCQYMRKNTKNFIIVGILIILFFIFLIRKESFNNLIYAFLICIILLTFSFLYTLSKVVNEKKLIVTWKNIFNVKNNNKKLIEMFLRDDYNMMKVLVKKYQLSNEKTIKMCYENFHTEKIINKNPFCRRIKDIFVVLLPLYFSVIAWFSSFIKFEENNEAFQFIIMIIVVLVIIIVIYVHIIQVIDILTSNFLKYDLSEKLEDLFLREYIRINTKKQNNKYRYNNLLYF